VDRFDAADKIRRALEDGCWVILDRYVDSNVGHQGGKISDPKEREKFINWLYDIEYRILNNPKPDLVIILHMPTELAKRLVDERGHRQDLHEIDIKHQKNAEAAYLWLAQKYPQDHKVVECSKGANQLRTPQDIHEELYKIIEKIYINR